MRRSIFCFSAFVLFLCKMWDDLAAWLIALRRCDRSEGECTYITAKLVSLNIMKSMNYSGLPGTRGI